MIDPRRPDYTDIPAGPRRPRFDYAPAGERAPEPLATVLTPFFNAGERFRETARSVMAQSLQAFEWIIVNDASTDPVSLAVLDEFRTLDPRVRVIDLPANSGPGAARNAGFAAARTEYVYQLDADDLIEPTTVEKCFWFLLRHPEYAFVHTYEVGFGAQSYLWTHGFHTPQMFLNECPVGSHTVMVRRSAHAAVGGYDESIRGGMEDWEFFVRAADRGHWGATMPEFLAWYRRRNDHGEHWADWDGADRQKAFHDGLKAKYPELYSGKKAFPQIATRWHTAFEQVARELPAAAPLGKLRPRLLIVAPWLRMGGADKFNLDLLDQLGRLGWEVTIACTVRAAHTWLPEFSARTPDIFLLHHFLRPVDHPLFVRHLIESRRPDVVMVSNSELGYMALPYLRSVCPGPAYVDYVHMEEGYWKNGGYARYSVGAHEQLDLTMVTSEHLKRWMVERGADGERVDVRYINVDPEQWKPDPELRARVRAELGVADDVPLVLFAGRLTAQKQPRVLGATFKELSARGEKFLAVIAGDGEDRAYLEKFVRDNHLGECVRLLGEASSARVRELMGAADIFFLPSLWEGIALVLFEAMAAGVAFVGANVGGQAEVCGKDEGVLIERSGGVEGEAARYADELGALLRDPERRERLGRAAMERIRGSFTLDAMGDGVAASLRRAIDLAERRPRTVLGAGFGHESADRAVEFIRVSELCDWLWAERERARAAPQPAAASSIEARPASVPIPSPAHSGVFEELMRIEGSRTYRLVQTAKRSVPYRAFARLRFGADWRLIEPAEDPVARLARIKNSRAYRLIEAFKRTMLYDAYARRRYGPDWKRSSHA